MLLRGRIHLYTYRVGSLENVWNVITFYDKLSNNNCAAKIGECTGLCAPLFSQRFSENTLLQTVITQLYHSVDRVDGPIVQQAPETLKPSKTTDDVKSWTADDVRNWIRKHNLPE